MEFPAFSSQIAGAQTLLPVYVFAGPESWLRREGIERLKETGEDVKRNALRLRASEVEWKDVAAELCTLPMMGGRKLVALVDEGSFVAQNADEIKEYAASAAAGAVLAIDTASEKLGGLTDGKTVRVVSCKPLKPADRARWVQMEFQRRGKAADRQAADLLARRGGEDLGALAGQIENAIAHAGKRAKVEAADVEAVVVEALEEKRGYQLALATQKKRPKEALEVLYGLLAAGEPLPKLMGGLASQYRKLVEAKKLLLAGRRRFEVTSQLGISFYPDEFLAFVDAHGLRELLDKHRQILEADVAMKTSDYDEAIMESLVLKLAA